LRGLVVYVNSGNFDIMVKCVSDVDCHAGVVYVNVFYAQAERRV
jgi:hypothetical protein